MTTRMRVGLATCAELSKFDEDAAELLTALSDSDVEAELARWDDPAVDWSAYDLVVIRSTWDYTERRDEFVSWAQHVPRLLNPGEIVKWNTHKGYLTELASAGLPVVPTAFVAPGERADLPAAGEYVVKPAVGAGARDTLRYGADDADAAQSHRARLHAAGRTAMIQPYFSAVDVHGESALLFLGGDYSHSVRKGPLLAAGGIDPRAAGYHESISPRTPTAAELALADRVLQSVPGGPDQLLYARVDLLADQSGSPVLLELELTEPSLFLSHSPGSAQRFAAAIALAAAEAVQVVTP